MLAANLVNIAFLGSFDKASSWNHRPMNSSAFVRRAINNAADLVLVKFINTFVQTHTPVKVRAFPDSFAESHLPQYFIVLNHSAQLLNV